MFTALVLAAAACNDPSAPNVDLGPAVDLQQDRAVSDLPPSPDAAPPAPPFKPADMLLGQLACVAAGLSTGTSTSSETLRQVYLSRLKSAGIALMRTDFLWHKIEKTKGTFDFSGYDLRVKAAVAAKVDHVALLAYGNPWATTKTSTDYFYPPDDPADFARFVKAVVARYKGQISTYEIWNEPNAGFRFWKTHPKGDPAAFGALLKAAYKAAKEADPKARVIYGGPFYHEQLISGHVTFLTETYKKHPDLSKHFDGMALHPYAIYPPSVPPEKRDAWEQPVYQMVNSVREVMAKHGAGSKPIITTEVGWPVWAEVSQAQQAQYLVRSFLLLAAAGNRAYCWYTMRDLKGHGVPTEATFGLFTYDADPKAAKAKPSWTAYKTLLNTLGQYKLVKDLRTDLSLPQTAFAYRLQDPKTKRQATAVWSTDTAGLQVDVVLKSSTSKVTRVGMMGQQTTLAPKAGKVQVTATVEPMYLLEE